MNCRLFKAAVVGLAAFGLVGLAGAAQAAPKPKAYANCASLNKDFKHGVAKLDGRDQVSGKAKPVTAFTVNPAVYRLNVKMDRDKDGVACEKK